MKCMRVESAHACPSGGWYHFYDSAKPSYAPRTGERRESVAQIDVEAILTRWQKLTVPKSLSLFAKSLNVSQDALYRLGCCFANEHKAWAFPMYDGVGSAVGIRLRSETGFKWTVTGSRQGVFVPSYILNDREPIAFLPEGPSDLAALLTIGLYGIGRPNNLGGVAEIKQILRTLKIYQAVIVADNDDMKKLGPRDGRPGIEGAINLQKNLGISSVIWIPPTPCKDVRDFIRNGGTKQMILDDIKNRVWKN